MTPLATPAAAGSAAEFAGTAFRLAVALGISIAALASAAQASGRGRASRRGGGPRRRELFDKAKPRRIGLAGLAALVSLADRRAHARDLLQARLRALALDLCAVRMELGETEARELVETGDFPPGAGAALTRDELASGGGVNGSDFLDNCDDIVRALEAWAEYREDKEPSDG